MAAGLNLKMTIAQNTTLTPHCRQDFAARAALAI
jgi:hypothetical protein